MSEMVERVAVALAASFRETIASVSGDSWEETGVTLPSKEVWERYAKAAIGALRTPNGPMVKAGVEERDRPGSGAAVSGIWYAMIDEALK